MEPLHRHDDETVTLIIEPTQSRVVEPIDGTLQRDLGVGIIGFDRVIDDQDVAAPTGQSASHGSCETISTPGRFELAFGVLLRVQPGTEIYSFEERRIEQRAAVTGEFVGEILRIAGADQPCAGVAAKQPGWQADRDDKRLQAPWGQIEDQPLAALPDHHLLDAVTHRVNVPIGHQALTGIERLKGGVHERTKMASVHCVSQSARALNLARHAGTFSTAAGNSCRDFVAAAKLAAAQTGPRRLVWKGMERRGHARHMREGRARTSQR